VDRSKVDPKMLKAAEGMEAMFLDYMMKVMRETVPKNDLDLESPATQIYRGMMDTEVSQKAARAGGIGLADLIVAYLDSQRYNLQQGARAAGAYTASEKTAKQPDVQLQHRQTGVGEK
jgi:Rod binding domain-containing protein